MKKKDKARKRKIAYLDNRLGRIKNKLDKDQLKEFLDFEDKIRSELGMSAKNRVNLG